MVPKENLNSRRKKKSNLSLVIEGDGRAHSPGHLTKYGSYTALDLEKSNVLDAQACTSKLRYI